MNENLDTKIERQLVYLVSKGLIKWEKDKDESGTYKARYNDIEFAMSKSSYTEGMARIGVREDGNMTRTRFDSQSLYPIWKSLDDRYYEGVKARDREEKEQILRKMECK